MILKDLSFGHWDIAEYLYVFTYVYIYIWLNIHKTHLCIYNICKCIQTGSILDWMSNIFFIYSRWFGLTWDMNAWTYAREGIQLVLFVSMEPTRLCLFYIMDDTICCWQAIHEGVVNCGTHWLRGCIRYNSFCLNKNNKIMFGDGVGLFAAVNNEIGWWLWPLTGPDGSFALGARIWVCLWLVRCYALAAVWVVFLCPYGCSPFSCFCSFVS